MIDHYDSFTYNLVQQMCVLGADTTVVMHDQIKFDQLLALQPTHYLLSPGPGNPTFHHDFQVSRELLHVLPSNIPIIGICLGMQGIAIHFGAQVKRAPKVMHGKTSFIMHDQQNLFSQLKNPTQVMRYHSLCVDTSTLPPCLLPSAWAPEDGVLMAFRHQNRPIYGVQFHPESIETKEGTALMDWFLNEAQLEGTPSQF